MSQNVSTGRGGAGKTNLGKLTHDICTLLEPQTRQLT